MAKLTVRAAYWIGCVVYPSMMAAISILVLFKTHYGNNVPDFLKIVGPIFLWGAGGGFFLVKFKLAREYREDSEK